MIIAIGINRILLGLGLAAVLEIIGVLPVRSRSPLERFVGIDSRWSYGLQLDSAVIVTALGVGITRSGLAAYLRCASVARPTRSPMCDQTASQSVCSAGAPA